jgi:hypothetical protein
MRHVLHSAMGQKQTWLLHLSRALVQTGREMRSTFVLRRYFNLYILHHVSLSN